MNDATSEAPLLRSRPVFARHAASLLLWREGPHGTEVLMGVRGAGHRFLPNRLVFPGGAVDPADKTSPAATEPHPLTLAHLTRTAQPKLARGLVMAAARELEEETSLSLGTPPSLDALRYLCRAVTPPSSPIRFNARFLLAPADTATGHPTDSRELHSVRFYPLTEALALPLMEVTREILHRLRTDLADPNPDHPHPRFAYKRHRWESD